MSHAFVVNADYLPTIDCVTHHVETFPAQLQREESIFNYLKHQHRAWGCDIKVSDSVLSISEKSIAAKRASRSSQLDWKSSMKNWFSMALATWLVYLLTVLALVKGAGGTNSSHSQMVLQIVEGKCKKSVTVEEVGDLQLTGVKSGIITSRWIIK